MSAAIATTEVSLLHPFQIEWRILRARQNNVLLEGPIAATSAALLLLQPHIREPIAWNQPHAPLDPPDGETGALILRDVAALSADDQTRLLVWLAGAGSRAQIVSTTEHPLFARVAQRLFDAELYYRLNVMLLRAGTGTPPAVDADDAELTHRRVDSPAAVVDYPRPVPRPSRRALA